MSDDRSDILIAGSGPIAASVAYFLSKNYPNLKLGLITQDPTDEHSATYTQAGGSLRWIWDDPLKSEMTSETANFIEEIAKKGVDLSLLEDHYLYLYTGDSHPSLNFSGKKLVQYLLDEAKKAGLRVSKNKVITGVDIQSNCVEVTAGNESWSGDKALLALGVANTQFMPDYKIEREKRQLFVLDLPVDEKNNSFPHIIARIGDNGYVFVFVKKTPDGMRYIVGQEDIIEDTIEGPNDYFRELVNGEAGEIFPFLKRATVEKILWGIDAGNKHLKLEDRDGKLFAANCGSAARSAIWIGRKIADDLAMK